MLAAYVTRGVKAGVVAGLVFGLLVALVANPMVAFADELGHEGAHTVDGQHAATGEHHDAATGHHHGDGAGERGASSGGGHHESAVSTAVTNGVSVVAGVLWGILLGGVVFGAAFYFLEPAIPGTGGTKSYLLAAAGFVTVSGAPWLVLPPQPPGVERALSPETRLALYGGMMVAGALCCLLAGFAYGHLRDARGPATAAVGAAASFGPLAVPVALSPATAVSGSLPAELATGLTGMIAFGQALLWIVLAGTHARLHRRSRNGNDPEGATTRTDGTVVAD